MIDVRVDISTKRTDRIGVGRIDRDALRATVIPGALVRAGTRMLSEWVRVDAVVGDEVLFTRMLPTAGAHTL